MTTGKLAGAGRGARGARKTPKKPETAWQRQVRERHEAAKKRLKK